MNNATPHQHDHQSGYVDVNGAQLYYEIGGQGAPLVLLNAGDFDCRMWDDQFDAFSATHRLLRYDARGYGKTIIHTAQPFRHIDDLRALMCAVGMDAATLLGSSFGALTALDFALHYPQLVTRLILISPGLSGYDFTSEIFQQYSAAHDAAFERGDIDGAIDVAVRMWVDGWERPAERVAPAVRGRVREMLAHAYAMPDPPESLPVEPAIGRLADLRVPVLIIVGAQDIPDIHTIADLLVDGIHHAQRVMIPDAAHMVNMEKPEQFYQTVLNFL